MNTSSYTAASVIPSKLFNYNNIDLMLSMIKHKHIFPIHIQINPTNKCPLNCSFCSYKNRDKNLEMDINKLKEITNNFYNLGTRAISITGGGDPLAYPYLGDYVNFCDIKNIKIGLVTNGLLFKSLKDWSFINKLTWCRISLSDEYDINKFKDNFIHVISNYKTDWSFSYVVTKYFDLYKLSEAIKIANKHNFTHIRVVDDILNNQSNVNMSDIKKELNKNNIDDKLVIYQGRKQYTKGHKKCLISLLKPNVGPDGNIFPCCGTIYRKQIPSLNLVNDDSMGNNIGDIWKNQKYFNGSVCDRCYYSDYNNILNTIIDSQNINHEKFI
jgi:MoaA/NifB/PqqE/SkfB family radical SAM enzyme